MSEGFTEDYVPAAPNTVCPVCHHALAAHMVKFSGDGIACPECADGSCTAAPSDDQAASSASPAAPLGRPVPDTRKEPS